MEGLQNTLIVAGVITVILTLAILFFIMPEKNKDRLNPFFSKVRDFFIVKHFWLQYFFRTVFILTTVASIVGGLFLMGSSFSDKIPDQFLWIGLAILVAGPIVSRLLYEGIELIFKTVNNISAIRNKVDKGITTDSNGFSEETEDFQNICPLCGAPNELDAVYCEQCGKRIQ